MHPLGLKTAVSFPFPSKNRDMTMIVFFIVPSSIYGVPLLLILTQHLLTSLCPSFRVENLLWSASQRNQQMRRPLIQLLHQRRHSLSFTTHDASTEKSSNCCWEIYQTLTPSIHLKGNACSKRITQREGATCLLTKVQGFLGPIQVATCPGIPHFSPSSINRISI